MGKIIPISVIALTIAAFGIGTSEFVIMGLLVDISQDLGVSIAKSGLLVTAYAMGVVIGGPIMAVLTSRFPRKETLIGLVLMFVAGNVFCALSKSYEMLIVARILTAMCHGTYFGVATVVAVQLVKPEYKAEAVAWVFMGTTLANMLGVPLGTAEGLAWGWRSTFWSVSLIGILAVGALMVWLPGNLPKGNQHPLSEFKTLKKMTVQIPLLLSALLNAGLFVVYTYIAPLLMHHTGLSGHGVTLVLLILGCGLPVGTLLGGKLGDWNLVKSLIVLFPVIMVTLVVLHYVVAYPVPAVMAMFIWSTLTFTIAPMLQLLVVDNASEAPNLASTFNQSAFNLGNAVGATLGSVMLNNHVDLDELPWISVAILIFAWGLVFVYKRLTQKTKIAGKA